MPNDVSFFARPDYHLLQLSSKFDANSTQLPDLTRQSAEAAFASYYNEMYEAMRTPMAHGHRTDDLAKIDAIRFPNVFNGIHQAWEAYDHLLTYSFEKTARAHTGSWSGVAVSHQLPITVDAGEYPDLNEPCGLYLRRYLEGLREEIEK